MLTRSLARIRTGKLRPLRFSLNIASMSDTRRTRLRSLLGPQYWPMWLQLGVVRLACLLPYPVLMALGRLLGRVGLLVLGERRRIASRNLELCLPELDAGARETLLRRHFESLGMAVFEIGLTWWASDRRLEGLARVEGLAHIERALEQGNGVILLSAHFTALEICSRMLATRVPLHAVYRPHRNRLLDEVMRRGRERTAAGTIAKDDVRQMVRTLRRNTPVWYAPDQAHSGKGAQLVPLFGIPAQTNTATSRLARLTGAPVLPFLPWRDADGYRIVVGEPIADFPSGDDAADAAHFHTLVEQRIREVPEQYLWIHRRFKNLPDRPDLYRHTEHAPVR